MIPPREEVPMAVPAPTTLRHKFMPSAIILAAEAFPGAKQALQMGPARRTPRQTQMGSVPEHPVGVAASCSHAETQLGARDDDDPDTLVITKGTH
jgi:hypothetical protein